MAGLTRKKTDADADVIANNLLPGGIGASLSDFSGGLPSSRYRQGKAQMIADAMGYETPFEIKHPVLSEIANAGIGAIPFGLAGAGLGALSGNPANAVIGGVAGAGLGGTAGAIRGSLSRMARMNEIKNTLKRHLEAGVTPEPRRPNIGGPFFGSGSMDAGNVDAYLALKNKEKIKPRTIGGSLASEAAILPYGLGLPLSSYANRSYAKKRLSEDDAKDNAKDNAKDDVKEKAASALRNLLVKKASQLCLDAFIDKVASAVPVTKRAAFRVIQTQLATGETLPNAIKVAFPRLDAMTRHALAINFCKCAVADSNKMTMREPESYNVPAKDAASTMKKCAAGEPVQSNLQFYNNPKHPNYQDPTTLFPTPSGGFDAFSNAVEAYPIKPPSNFFDKLQAFHAKNPYVLPGLGIGAAGLGAYGLYNAMKKKRRRPEFED